jgi:hypothetical protein
MKYKKLLVAILLSFFVFPLVANAGGLKGAFGGSSPLGNVATKAGVDDVGDVETVTGRVINAALTLVGIIFLILMVYGGFLWMTARGNEEQVTKAQKVIYGTIIGLVVILSAYAITVFVTSKLAGS